MGFNCPNLVSLFICTDHIEFIHQKIGDYLVVRRMQKRLHGEVNPYLYCLNKKSQLIIYKLVSLSIFRSKYKFGTNSMKK